MADLPVSPPTLDEQAAQALRGILDDPALPVGSTAAGPDGPRIAALREAHDFVSSQKLAVTAAWSPEAAGALVDSLARIDPTLAATLRWHATLAPFLSALPASRPRNALLGNIRRGELFTWATAVGAWTWRDGSAPDAERPLGRADGEIESDEFPGLYDTVLLWEPSASALVALPTHRARLSWEPVEPPTADAGRRWKITLTRVTIHADELVRLETDPRTSPAWREPGGAWPEPGAAWPEPEA
ncbi:hypothetical protein [Frankia tisae]|uniref:hypothetical protein n=1 Tax=Frankia tisae TaxID=2950104 RepID=UPI0021C189FC|nr:hypothetical protein [Frankia tisae]